MLPGVPSLSEVCTRKSTPSFHQLQIDKKVQVCFLLVYPSGGTLNSHLKGSIKHVYAQRCPQIRHQRGKESSSKTKQNKTKNPKKTLILQIRNLRPREETGLAQDYTVSE